MPVPFGGSMKMGILNRIAQSEFVRTSIEQKADLSAFKGRPTARTYSGLILVGFSYIIAWPAISVLGVVSVHLRKPSVIVLGGPVLYAMSHLLFMAGIWLAGAEYAMAFLRWATRVAAERWMDPDDYTKSSPPEERSPFKGHQKESS